MLCIIYKSNFLYPNTCRKCQINIKYDLKIESVIKKAKSFEEVLVRETFQLKYMLMGKCEIVDEGINSVTPFIDASHTQIEKVKTYQFSSELSRCSTRLNQSF